MRRIFRRRPSSAMVIGCLALSIALGGSAYAAVTVSGKNIKDGTVTRQGRQEPLARHEEAEREGRQLADRPARPGGISGLEYRVEASQRLPSGTWQSWSVACPSGKRALGGGVSSTEPYYTRVLETASAEPVPGWMVAVRNEDGPTFTAYGPGAELHAAVSRPFWVVAPMPRERLGRRFPSTR